MKKEYEDLARNLLGEEKSKKLDMNSIAALMNSPEGKALMKQFGGPDGEAVKQAAGAAGAGDTAAAQNLLKTVLGTKEGQALMQQVMQMKKK